MKTKSQYILTVFLLFTFCTLETYAQEPDDLYVRLDSVEIQIRRLETTIPGLNEKVNISLTDVPLNEFLRAVANNSGLNMDIDPLINQNISNNFADVGVSDVLIFLSRQFKLDITIMNNIFIVRQMAMPSVPPLCFVQYNDSTRKLTIEVEDEQLSSFLKEVTRKSGRNVIPAFEVGQLKVSSFILSMPFEEAIDKMAFSNNLISRPTPDGFILIEKRPVEKSEIQAYRPDAGNYPVSINDKSGDNSVITVKQLDVDSLYVFAENAQLDDVIRAVAERCGRSYILSSASKTKVNVQIIGDTFDDIIDAILAGSDLVAKKNDGIYVIGIKESTALMGQKVIHLQYRSIDSISYAIPKDLLDQVELLPFKELNSILLSGPEQKVATLTAFISEIDKSVPVISIEVLIIDYSSSYTISSGITAGIGEAPVPATTGTVFPAVDVTLNSQSINDLINRFNGLGWANIGKVTPNFYASLRLLESQGILKIRSTPILSTLNGHKAELSIGNTEYYMEESVNIIGTQNPQTATTQTYKPVTAELAVTITPQVSGDDQITLEVEVTQSDFTERISTNAPPGQVSRTFKSQIRVKDGEMILLGGLEEKRNNKTSSGTPFLSRIPIIKWLFSSREEINSKSKLNIFIKPSILN